MFANKFYVPILRFKPAELEALSRLDAQDRIGIVPLLELLPKSFVAPDKGSKQGKQPRPEDVFAQIARETLRFWGNDPFFLDFQHLVSLPDIHGLHPLAFATRELRTVKAHPILVGHLTDSLAAQSSLRTILDEDKRGICLRVAVPEVLEPTFPKRVLAYLRAIGVAQNSVDLLVDYQAMGPNSSTFPEVFGRVPDIRKWRTLIVALGGFPENLADLWPDRHLIRRQDWIFYRDQVLYERLPRQPIFSDYTIQFGVYKEPLPNSNPSASIRYTMADHWVIMRGHGLRNKNGPKNEQYPAHAQLLCESEDFCGATFSDGDAYIYRKYMRDPGFGTPQTWLCAGINHHMTFVVRQLGGTDIRAIPNYRGDRPVESIQPYLRSQSK